MTPFHKTENVRRDCLILDDCAMVSQGAILSRVQTLPALDAVNLSLYTMKEMNESLGHEYRGSTDRLQEINVPKSKADQLPFTKEGMVLVNLTAHRAVAVRHEHIGRLITSNFAIIEPNEQLNALYLEWYFNEHPTCQKQLRIATQGTSVSALSIHMLRSLRIQLPNIKDQHYIGSIYRRIYEKKRLIAERMILEEKWINHSLLRYLQEEHQ